MIPPDAPPKSLLCPPPPLPFSRRGQCPRHSACPLLARLACSQRGPRVDDKRLQNTLKRLGVNTIPGIEEVNLFKVRNIGSRCRHDTRGLAITLVPVCRLCPLSARGVERGRPDMEMRGRGGGGGPGGGGGRGPRGEGGEGGGGGEGGEGGRRLADLASSAMIV
eukprot:COSAG01_NODE_592_length_15109_cov_39.247435_21_plen_163_part_01